LVDITEWRPVRILFVLAGSMVVALVAGVFIGRLTSPSGGKPTPVPATTSIAGPTVGSTPPSPTTAPPIAAGSGLPGAPTRLNSLGIPVGYPHTEAGAISACGNYVAAYGDVRNRDATILPVLLRTIATPSEASSLTIRIRKNDTNNASILGVESLNSPNVNFNLRVVGYKVVSSANNMASVSVWSAGGFGIYGSSNPATETRQVSGTDNCTVTWTAGDWKLANAVDGPSGPDMTDRAADGFSRFAFTGGVTK
jgi:hypothetical protein